MLDDSMKYWINPFCGAKIPLNKVTTSDLKMSVGMISNKIGEINDEIKEKTLEYKKYMKELDIVCGEVVKRRKNGNY